MTAIKQIEDALERGPDAEHCYQPHRALRSDMRDDNIDGGPAFPTDSESQIGNALWHHSGMTLRDYFAAQAMQSVLDGSWPDLQLVPKNGLEPIENSAIFAYQIADAMIKARAA